MRIEWVSYISFYTDGADTAHLEEDARYVINELGTARTISSSGTVTKGRRGGLQTDLYHCRVGDWLVVDGAQADDSQVPNGALFYDGGKKALSFKDDQGKVHALHGAGGA